MDSKESDRGMRVDCDGGCRPGGGNVGGAGTACSSDLNAARAGGEEQAGAQHEREAVPQGTGTAGDGSWRRQAHAAGTMPFPSRLSDSFFLSAARMLRCPRGK